VIDMDADELLLRRRVHHAYDALAPSAPLPAQVLDRVHARVEVRARRSRWTMTAVATVAALAVLAFVGLQMVPRSAHLQAGGPPAGPALGGTSGGGGNSSGSDSLSEGATQANGTGAASAGPLGPCPSHSLQVTVATDQRTYQQGAVVTVHTSVRNRGRTACRYPLGPAVWVTDGKGTQWRLCPEVDAPPPSPAVGAMPVPAPPAAVVMPRPGGLRPGQSEATSCTWHTAYGDVPPGTYTAHATWDHSSGLATIVITPGPSPTPEPTMGFAVTHPSSQPLPTLPPWIP
jgi:hypothetical protein